MRRRLVDGQAQGSERRSGYSFVGMNDERTCEDAGGLPDGEVSLACVLHESGVGYWRHDVATGQMDCSTACKVNLGLAPDGELATLAQLKECIHPEDRRSVEQAIERAIENADGFDVQHRIRAASGEVRWVRARARVFRRADGRVVIAGTMFDLTEEKRAEAERERLIAELAAERARLRAVLDQLPAGVFLADPSGRIVMANAALRALHRQECLSDMGDLYRSWRLFDADGRLLAPNERPFVRALEGETVSLVDLRFVQVDDGTDGWIRLSSAPIRDGAGAITGVVVVAFDVGPEKRAERALRTIERRLRQLFESPVIGVIQSHVDGRVMDANDTFLEMSGFTRDDLREGRLDWKRMTPPELRQADAERLRELLETGTIRHCEKAYVRKDGTRVPVLIGSTLLDGSRTEIVTFVLDISERKRAELEREELLRSLERSEERYRLVALATEDVIYDWDLRTGRFSVQTMSGEPRAYVDEVQSWTERIHPDDLERLRAELHAVIERGDRHWQTEYRFSKGDGTWLIVVDRSYLAFDADGRAVRLVGAMRDVTLRRKQQEFERQLIGIVSHDLRNPLNTVTLAAHMLVQSAGLGARSMTNAVRIQSAAARATRMIHDLLDFTKARLGTGIPLERRAVDVGALFAGLVDETRAGHPHRRIDLHATGELVGLFDGDRLAQVLTNLLENALKYGAPGSPVRVTLQGAANEVTLAVHNQGLPLPPELVARIFEPLQRGDVPLAPATRSVGLGLYIVKHLVEAHGGRIEVRSESGAGTTFRVSLPRSEATSAA